LASYYFMFHCASWLDHETFKTFMDIEKEVECLN